MSEAQYKPLEASYRIGSKTVLDPPPKEKKDRVYLWITRDGAKAIYEAMPAGVEKNHCGDEGLRAKRAGDLQCVKSSDGDVQCSVAIALDRGRTALGSVC